MTPETLFSIQKEAFKKNRYSSLLQRKKILKILLKSLKKEANAIASVLNEDFGTRLQEESYLLEMLPTIGAIRYCLKQIKPWMKPKKRKVPWHFALSKAYTKPMPLGVIGIMVPWNYPIFLSLIPMIYALSAGNRVLIKFSELTPKTADFFETFFKDIWGHSSPVSVVKGDIEVSKAFSRLPFSHLFFSGSEKVGKEIAKEAMSSLMPITLELGGKSPVFLSTSYHLSFLKRLLMGKLFNSGQSCIAPDYLLVKSGEEEKLLSEIKTSKVLLQKEVTLIISDAHYQRLMTLVEDAKEKGALIHWLGTPNPEKRYFPLCLILKATEEMRVLQEEIFGPIFPILPYTSIEHAISLISSRPKPLVVYYFGESEAEKDKLFYETISGSFVINDTLTQVACDDLPFGGIGESGFGQYHSEEGFLLFSHQKSVWAQARISPFTWCYPPYGRFVSMIIRFLSGIRYDSKH